MIRNLKLKPVKKKNITPIEDTAINNPNMSFFVRLNDILSNTCPTPPGLTINLESYFLIKVLIMLFVSSAPISFILHINKY